MLERISRVGVKLSERYTFGAKMRKLRHFMMTEQILEQESVKCIIVIGNFSDEVDEKKN